MGQQQSSGRLASLSSIDSGYTVEEDIEDGSLVLLKHRERQGSFAMKELTFTSTQQFNKALKTITSRKQLKNDHYLGIEEFFTKSDVSFCSMFHRITAIYQYSSHTLKSQVQARTVENKSFEEKQLWSILCSCCIAIAFLQKNNISYKVLSTNQIFLTPQGVVKIGDPDLMSTNFNGNSLRRLQQYYSPEQMRNHTSSNSGCVFSLGMCLLELIFLQSLTDCYDYDQHRMVEDALKSHLMKLQKLNLSECFQQVLLKMLMTDQSIRPTMTQLEIYLAQLVDTTESSEDVKSVKKNIHEERLTEEPENEEECGPISPMVMESQEIGECNLVVFQSDVEMPDDAEEKTEGQLTGRSYGMPVFQRNHISSNAKLNSAVKFEKEDNILKERYRQERVEKVEPDVTKKLMPQYPSASKQENDLFTDPKLLQMVRQEIQEINMRRSKIAKPMPPYDDSGLKMEFRHQSAISPTNDSFMKAKYEQTINEVEVFRKVSLPKPSQLTYVTENYSKGRYEGQKKGKLRHGFGTFYYKEGGKYTGDWKENKMSGKGILYYVNDQVAYDGEWKEDRLWGYGVLYNEDPHTLNHSFNYADWDDVDQFWVKYEGHFIDDNKHGKGKLFLSNGETFQGHFDRDLISGEGTFCRSDGTIVKGMWSQNHLVRLL